MDIHQLNTSQLEELLDIKRQIEELEHRYDMVLQRAQSGANGKPQGPVHHARVAHKPVSFEPDKPKRVMSPEARARIAAAQKARWSKQRAPKPSTGPVTHILAPAVSAQNVAPVS